MTLNAILAKRGILEAAFHAGWRAFTWRTWLGWSYPVSDVWSGAIILAHGRQVLHWKNAAANGPKYGWPFGSSPNVVYYALPGLRAQIQANRGVLYLASGSPDVLAYQSAGLPALSWFNGEESVPDGLADDLGRLDVHQVVYCPDLDRTGELSAAKVAAALAGRLPLICYRLPTSLGTSGDINRLWQTCQFDDVTFRSALQSLQTFEPLVMVKQEPGRGSPEGLQADRRAGACPDCERNYFNKVLESELATLAHAPEHDRNNQLNRAAFILGTLLGAGIGQRGEVERGLADVAKLRGLAEYETVRTIKSGLEAGLKKPRLVQLGESCPHRRK